LPNIKNAEGYDWNSYCQNIEVSTWLKYYLNLNVLNKSWIYFESNIYSIQKSKSFKNTACFNTQNQDDDEIYIKLDTDSIKLNKTKQQFGEIFNDYQGKENFIVN